MTLDRCIPSATVVSSITFLIDIFLHQRLVDMTVHPAIEQGVRSVRDLQVLIKEGQAIFPHFLRYAHRDFDGSQIAIGLDGLIEYRQFKG